MNSNTRTLVATLGVAAAACLLAACPNGGTSRPTPRPGRRHSRSRRNSAEDPSRAGQTHAISPTVETTGTVEFDSDRATQVLAPFSGPVSRILVSLGSTVKKREPLATIVSADFATAVSGYRKATASATNARRVADLDEQLFKNDGISRREMEQAQSDAISAEADRDAAIQQLRALGVAEKSHPGGESRPVTASQALIRSPLAGTVVERLITPGQLCQAGATPCFTVADMSTVWVMANIFESDLSFVSNGDSADIVTAAAPSVFIGKVDYIAALVDPNTRAVSVRIVTPNPTGILKKDMYVRVAIHSRSNLSGLLLPVSAVLRDDEDLPFVFVRNGDNSFARRRVTIGARVGDRQEILQGLKAGEQVVMEGGLFMQFAQSQ